MNQYNQYMAKTQLTISVIIPTYNRAQLIVEAIDSVLAQTRIPDEIIVIDDGSTDNTREVLRRFGALVRVIPVENRGPSAARNLGLEASTGDLIAFLDDDDTLTPESIELRAEFLEQHQSFDVVYGDIRITDLLGNEMWRHSQRSGTDNSESAFAALTKWNIMPIHAFMFRRSCFSKVQGFDTDLRVLEDHQFWLRMSLHFKFHYLDHVMGDYRYHEDQVTTKKHREMCETQIAVRSEFIQTPEFQALHPAQRAVAFATQGTQCFQIGRTGEARSWYHRAIREHPVYLRPYILFLLTPLGQRGFEAMLALSQKFRAVRLR